MTRQARGYLGLFLLNGVTGMTWLFMLRGHVERERWFAGATFYATWVTLMWLAIGVTELGRWWRQRK